jgi:hypothetical protein
VFRVTSMSLSRGADMAILTRSAGRAIGGCTYSRAYIAS